MDTYTITFDITDDLPITLMISNTNSNNTNSNESSIRNNKTYYYNKIDYDILKTL